MLNHLIAARRRSWRAFKPLVLEMALQYGSGVYRMLFTDREIGWAIEGIYDFPSR
jgi:hypothetical protein